MKKVKLFIAALMLSVMGAFALAPAMTVNALDPLAGACDGNAASEICDKKDGEEFGNIIGTVINTLLFLIGLLSVIMIIYGGILYTTSSGDTGAVTKAKNTLIYSVVGLLVAFLAFAIINWVFKLF